MVSLLFSTLSRFLIALLPRSKWLIVDGSSNGKGHSCPTSTLPNPTHSSSLNPASFKSHAGSQVACTFSFGVSVALVYTLWSWLYLAMHVVSFTVLGGRELSTIFLLSLFSMAPRPSSCTSFSAPVSLLYPCTPQGSFQRRNPVLTLGQNSLVASDNDDDDSYNS